MSDEPGFDDSEPHPLIDEAMEELAIAEACEPTEDYESEEGIRLFFERLRNGWRVDRAGRMRPPKNLNITPAAPPPAHETCTGCGVRWGYHRDVSCAEAEQRERAIDHSS